MKHLLEYEIHEVPPTPEQQAKLAKFKPKIGKDKQYFDDKEGIAIRFYPKMKIMWIGNSKSYKHNYTIKNIHIEDEIEQIKNILKDVDPKLWKETLEGAGYEISKGGDYYDIIEEK